MVGGTTGSSRLIVFDPGAEGRGSFAQSQGARANKLVEPPIEYYLLSFAQRNPEIIHRSCG
jgi:hypothetical protein